MIGPGNKVTTEHFIAGAVGRLFPLRKAFGFAKVTGRMTGKGPIGMPRRVRVKGVASLLEQAARLIHGAGHSEGLYPAQWTALRYFAEATPQARTAAGLMRYQNMAMSPVARTVRALVEKGLVSRQPNPRDGRSDLIEVTPEGRALLRFDPRNNLEAVLGRLPSDQLASLALALQTVIHTMADKEGAGSRMDEAAKGDCSQP